MDSDIGVFFDGTRWNRSAVVAAQRSRAEAEASDLGHEVRRQDLLCEPLPASFVEEFERVHRVRLPSTYRSFLLEVGDGGRGPGLAMRRLGAPFEESVAWEEGEISCTEHEPNLLLDRPFPHTDAPAPDPDFARALDANTFPDEWITEGDTTPFGYDGALFLFDHGCAMWDMLVVTGDSAGEMWADRMTDGEGIYPIERAGSRVDFAQHYCTWLLGEDDVTR